MADFGTVNPPLTVTLGALIDSYLIYSDPVLYGAVLEPLGVDGIGIETNILSSGQLYPR